MIQRIFAQLSQNDIRNTGVPFVDATDQTFGKILETVFVVAGGIAVLVITVAGLFYVISLGNPQSTKKAKDTILYALIGLGICIFAYTIVRFVIGRL